MLAAVCRETTGNDTSAPVRPAPEVLQSAGHLCRAAATSLGMLLKAETERSSSPTEANAVAGDIIPFTSTSVGPQERKARPKKCTLF